MRARSALIPPNLPLFSGRPAAQGVRRLLGVMADLVWKFERRPLGRHSRRAGYKRREILPLIIIPLLFLPSLPPSFFFLIHGKSHSSFPLDACLIHSIQDYIYIAGKSVGLLMSVSNLLTALQFANPP